MAGHNEEIAIKIGAKDEASKVIDKLAKKIDGMEHDEARITVTANVDKLQDQLDRARIKLGTLDGDEATVQARLVGTLEQDLEDAKTLFKELDGKTGTVKVDVDVDTDKLDTVKQKTDSVGESGRAAGTAIGGIGGSISELPGVGALGPIAESLGQLTENALEGGESIAGLASAFGVLAGAAVVMAGINDIMQSMAKGQAASKAFNTKQVEQFNDALVEGGKVADNYADAIKETGKVLADTGTKAGPAWTNILPGVNKVVDVMGVLGKFGDKVEDILPLLNKAGVSSDLWTKILTSDQPVQAMEQLRAALAQTNISDEERHKILIAAKAAQDNYSDSVTNGAVVQQFFGEALDAGTTAWVKSTAATIEAKVALEKTTTAEREAAAKARLLADKVAEFTAQYDIMTGRINTSNAALDLADAFDEAATNAGKLYLQILDHSPEVEQTARDQARLQNDLKLKVIEYADELGKLPPEKITEINALIDQGDLTTAEKQLETLTRNRDVNIRIIANGGAGYAPISGPGSGPRAAPATAQMVGIPTSQQIAKQIGPVRIPADVYVRSSPRITGIRD